MTTDAKPAVTARPGALARAWQASRAIDPRYLIAGLITLVLFVAQFRYHMVGGYERLLLSLAVCTATEAAGKAALRGSRHDLHFAKDENRQQHLEGVAPWSYAT